VGLPLCALPTARPARTRRDLGEESPTLPAWSAMDAANPRDLTVPMYYVPRQFADNSKLQAYLAVKTPGVVSLPKRDYNLYQVRNFWEGMYVGNCGPGTTRH
jgi:hypothetical protein